MVRRNSTSSIRATSAAATPRPGKRNGTTGRSHEAGSNGKSNGDAGASRPSAPPRTTLSDKVLAEFRELLLNKRRELAGDVGHMEQEALRGRSGDGGDSRMPIHMADVGTDNYEQEFTLGLVATEREVLKEIDAALERIRDHSYGVCEGTGKPISLERLRVKPWARYCLSYKKEQERRGRR